MNKFEEIQEIIKNFIYEKQQMRREIAKIERQRTQLAKERNEKKTNAKTMKVVAEISELGKRITELGNQSQELQNKLDSRYLEVRGQVNTHINNLIAQGISEIRKHEEIKKEKQVAVEKQEERKSKYQTQKQEFYNRFGRMPELSETAQKENQAKEEECKLNKEEIAKIEEIIQILQGELSELAKEKRQFKNGEWAQLVQIEEQPVELEEDEEEIVEEIQENPDIIEAQIEEAEEQCDLEAILNLVEDIIEERENTSKTEAHFENEEEAVELPFINKIAENNSQEIEKTETIQEIEEIKVEDFQPIEDLNVEEIQVEEKNIPEVKIEERTTIVKFFKRNKLRENFKNGKELMNYLKRFEKFDKMGLISINRFSNIGEIKTPIWIEYRHESNSIEAHYERYYEFRNGIFVDDMFPERKSIVSVGSYYEYNQIPDLFISEGSKYDLEAVKSFYEFIVL